MSDTMKAYVYRKAGLPTQDGVLTLETSYPIPIPKNKEILIKVKASSLNPVGWKSMSQAPLSWFCKRPGVAPESDFAGIIAGGNLTGTDLKMGDNVFGITPAEDVTKSGNGTLAEYTLASPELTVKKPKNLSFEEAAAFPLAGLTAWHALVNEGGIKEAHAKGQSKKVLINGGSGGVGSWAIQIAKNFGSEVTVTGSKESTSLLQSLGADHVIDYKSDLVKPLHEYLKKTNSLKENKAFDIIFDPIGDQLLYSNSPYYLNETGKYIDLFGGIHLDSIGGIFNSIKGLINHLVRPVFLGGVPRNFKVFMLPAHTMGSELREARDLLESGKLRPTIEGGKSYSFDNVLGENGAYAKQISGRSKGKVVITI